MSEIHVEFDSLDIGIDNAGNLAISDNGNLLLPVKPFGITVTFGIQSVAPDGSVTNGDVIWDCTRLRLVSDNEKNSFKSCFASEKTTVDYNEYQISRESGNYSMVGNARNLYSAGDTYGLSIYGAVSIPDNVGRVESAPVTVTVDWGFARTSVHGYICHEMKKLATLTVDFDQLAITLLEGNLSSRPFECEAGSEIKIPIYAPYVWCVDQTNRPGDTGEYFTEDLVPIPNVSYIWKEMDFSVTVEADESEEEALEAAAFGKVTVVEMRDYIVGDAQYWRNEAEDVAIGNGYKKRITVQTIDILGKDHSYPKTADRWKLWIDLGPGIPNLGVGDTRIMYRNAWDTELDNNGYDAPEDQLAEYSVENCLIGESAPWFDCTHFGVMWLYYVYDDNGSERHYGYCLPTGNSVAITNDPDGTMPDHVKGEIVYREHRTYDGKHTFWINDDVYGTFQAAYPGKPYWSFNENSAMWEIKPDTHDDNERPYHLIRHPFNIQTSVCFEYNGLLYGIGEYMGDHHGAVYELDTLKAWTTPPCSQQTITVYTDSATPKIEEPFYIYDQENEIKTQIGLISEVGNSVYSITDDNGLRYYFKEDRSSAKDEEFE